MNFAQIWKNVRVAGSELFVYVVWSIVRWSLLPHSRQISTIFEVALFDEGLYWQAISKWLRHRCQYTKQNVNAASMRNCFSEVHDLHPPPLKQTLLFIAKHFQHFLTIMSNHVVKHTTFETKLPPRAHIMHYVVLNGAKMKFQCSKAESNWLACKTEISLLRRIQTNWASKFMAFHNLPWLQIE